MKKYIEQNYDYLFGFLLLCVPFGKAFPNIIIALLAVCFVFIYRGINFRRLKTIPFLTYYAFISYVFIKAAVTQSLFTEWYVYKKLIVLFIIPVLLLGVKKTQIVKVAAVAGTVVSILISLVLICRFYSTHGNLPFTLGADVNTLMLMERPYMGFYALVGALLAFDLIKNYPKQKIVLITAGLLSIGYILLISARISFITLVMAAGIYILFYLRISALKKAGLVGFSLLAVGAVMLLNKNIADRFFIKQSMEEAIAATDYEPRLVIWPCAYNMTKNSDFNAAFGYPDTATIINHFVDCYETTIVGNDSKKAYFTETKFNSHNQFIDIYLSTGLIGLLLFLSFLVSTFIKIRYSFFDTALLLALVLFLLVENVLHRQTGCYIFSIFTALLLMRNTNVNDEN